MGREYKPDLLVSNATVTRFDKPWSILIDSGASGNCVRRCSLEWNLSYAETLQAQKGNTFTVRLATVTLVTVPKVPTNLVVKFFNLTLSKAV